MTIAFRPLKRAALQAFQRTGGFDLVADSDWRRQRLLILCYHGISLDDEHLWNGSLYMPPELFEQRLRLLQTARCTVLPLAEGIARLYAGTLPDRSVAVTFDDGYHDFVAAAHPLLKKHGIPATVYLPTLHCGDRAPTFPLCASYMLWKARGNSRVSVPEIQAQPFDLSSAAGRHAALAAVNGMSKSHKLSHPDQQQLLRRLADRLNVDFDAILAKRVLQIMDPADATRLAHEGSVDIQLHTHRHRTPHDRLKFIDEIETNRERIEALTGHDARHFCYPSGAYEPEFLPWLAETRVISATTCDPGLASRRTPPLMLPRLIDTCTTSASEFQGWLSGAAWLITPRRSYAHAEHAS
jgi:peptidoglycan/xylan/chitin deacetylase (PgdA/CDA1 family)